MKNQGRCLGFWLEQQDVAIHTESQNRKRNRLEGEDDDLNFGISNFR